MSAVFTLLKRDASGKKTVKQLKDQGLIPVVIYKQGTDSEMLAMSSKEAEILVSENTAKTRLIEFNDVNGKKTKLLIKDIQFHPVTDRVIHIDFARCKANEVHVISCPVKFINHQNSTGLKRGGDVVHIAYNVPLKVKVSSEPIIIEIDLSGSMIGDKFHLSSAVLPKNCELVKEVLVGKLIGKRVKDAGKDNASAASEGSAESTAEA